MPTKTQLYNIDVLPESAAASKVSLFNAGGTFSVDLTAPSGMTENVALSLPTSTGSLGQVMTSDGTGGQYWATSTSGKVVQVVTGSTTTTVSVATLTYTDTTLTATITPTSATNTIAIFVMQGVVFQRTNNTQGVGVRLLRNAAIVYQPQTDAVGGLSQYFSLANVTALTVIGHVHLQYVDAPATTSALTYKTQGRPYNITNAGTASFQGSGSVNNQLSTIILMEIAP